MSVERIAFLGRRQPLSVLFGALFGAILLALAACQTVAQAPSASVVEEAAALPRAPVDSQSYVINDAQSDIRFLVFRAGPLARLGHNHVVQAKNIRGEIRLAKDIHQSSFFIELPVKDFLVDAESARLAEGAEFFPQPDADAIAGTLRNMLGERVLDAARFATIEIRSLALSGPAAGMDVALRIRLHGVERDMVVPTVVELSDGRIVASAFFSIRQSDFGITPLSVLGGALQVADTVKVRLRLVADRAS